MGSLRRRERWWVGCPPVGLGWLPACRLGIVARLSVWNCCPPAGFAWLVVRLSVRNCCPLAGLLSRSIVCSVNWSVLVVRACRPVVSQYCLFSELVCHWLFSELACHCFYPLSAPSGRRFNQCRLVISFPPGPGWACIWLSQCVGVV